LGPKTSSEILAEIRALRDEIKRLLKAQEDLLKIPIGFSGEVISKIGRDV